MKLRMAIANRIVVGRRHLLGLALLISCVVSALPCVEAEAAWSQFQGDAGHTGFVETNLNAATLTSAWTAPALPYAGDPGDRDVVIMDGDVYATMAQDNGSKRTYWVNRFDGATGVRQWQTGVAGSSPWGVSAPTVAGNTVYVHHWGHSDSSGSVYPNDYPALVGLNKGNGNQLFWTTHTGQWGSGGRPTVEGNAVFAAGGYYGGLDRYELNGVPGWFAAVNQQYGWIPAADASNVYVYMGKASASPGPTTGSLFVFNRSTGDRTTVLHPQSTDYAYGELQTVMLGGNGDAFALSEINEGMGMVAFDLASRSVKWNVKQPFTGAPAVGNGIIAAPSTTGLVVLDQNTGGLLWSWNGGQGQGNAVLTDHYAFVRAGGSVHAIDLLTHSSVWNSGGIVGDIALDGNLLVVSNGSGVYAFAGVPEPSSIWLLLLSSAGCGLFLCRRGNFGNRSHRGSAAASRLKSDPR